MAKKVKAFARKLEAIDKKYELMLVLQPELLESALNKKLKEFESFLAENGGKVDLKDVWGKRDLAYRISGHDAGIYVAYNLVLPTTFLKELDEHMRIDKDIIRSLIVKLDDNYEYQRYEEEVPAAEVEEKDDKKAAPKTHRASTPAKAEVKDKGKKADSGSLDNKLDAILEGDDIKV